MACGECRGMCSNGISQIEEEDEVENDSANLDWLIANVFAQLLKLYVKRKILQYLLCVIM